VYNHRANGVDDHSGYNAGQTEKRYVAKKRGNDMKIFNLSAIFALLAAPVFGENHVTGDAAAGEAVFAKQCVSCHVVVNEAGETLAGRKAKTGPNLYGVAMRSLGIVPGFRYGDSMVQAGEAGLVWDEANFVGYVMDPTGWLRVALEDPKARGKMSFKVRKEEDALNMFAFLAEIGPEIETEEVAEAEEEIEEVAVEALVSFSSDQADRGKVRYDKDCEECHAKDLKGGGLNGGAPIRGVNFLQKYAEGAPASWLFEFMSTEMPPNSPGRYSATTYADLMAYVLKRNGFNAGAPLPADLDALDQLIMRK
jgi:cytochrome c